MGVARLVVGAAASWLVGEGVVKAARADLVGNGKLKLPQLMSLRCLESHSTPTLSTR